MICVFDFKESQRVGSAFHHHFTGSVACALTCSVSLIDVCGLNYSTINIAVLYPHRFSFITIYADRIVY